MSERIVRLEKSDFSKFIEEDLSEQRYKRFPVRFILVENTTDWIDIIKNLEDRCEIVVKLSEFCRNPQVVPDINEAIKKASEEVKKGKKVLFLPLSEFMRFFEVYDDFLAKLSQLQIDPKQSGRLYVPLVFSKDKFLRFWNEIPLSEFQDRKKPAIEIIPSGNIHMRFFVTNIGEISAYSDFLPKNFVVCEGFQKYLKLFEKPEFHPQIGGVILISELVLKVLRNSKFEDFRIKKIENYKEFLEFLLGVETPMEFEVEEETFWKELMREILSSKQYKFEEFVKSYLNVAEFRLDLFLDWRKLNEFKKWLLFNWGKVELEQKKKFGKKYLALVLSSCKRFKEFERLIWLRIFDEKEPQDYLIEERRELIEKINPIPPREFFDKIYKIEDAEKRIKFLTSTTSEERKILVETVRKLLESGKNLEDILLHLERAYIDLYQYLTFPPHIQNYEEIIEYFKYYKLAKLENNFEKYRSKIYQSSEKIKIFEFSPRNEILEKIEGKNVILIDGMGLEWLGLIYHSMKKAELIVNVQIARSSIPTTSEFNKVPESLIIKNYKDLDLFYHTLTMEYPEYFIKELEILKGILEDIRKLVEEHGEVVLTSDHGSTRFSGWVEDRIELLGQYEVERNGRYAKTTQRPPDSPDYLVETSNGVYYVVSKTHKVFRGGKKVKGENHGGATVEEVLVPVIEVKKPKIKKKIVLLDYEISPLKPSFRIRTSPNVKKVSASVKGKACKVLKIKDEIWEIEVPSTELKPGSIFVEIVINEKEVHKCNIKVKGGMEEEELL